MDIASRGGILRCVDESHYVGPFPLAHSMVFQLWGERFLVVGVNGDAEHGDMLFVGALHLPASTTRAHTVRADERHYRIAPFYLRTAELFPRVAPRLFRVH